MQLVLFELVKELLVHPFHEVKCDGISCSWDEDFKTCNCILSPVRGNGLFRIHQGLYLDENLQYEISPIAKIDQPFIFIGFQGEMSAFNFLIYDWLKALAVSSHYIFCWLLLNQPNNIFISYSKREKLRWWLLLNNFGQLLPQIWDSDNRRTYLNGPVNSCLRFEIINATDTDWSDQAAGLSQNKYFEEQFQACIQNSQEYLSKWVFKVFKVTIIRPTNSVMMRCSVSLL